jgi:NAD(P)H-hydrate epimerase
VTEPSRLPRLPERAADSHKGDYGRALLVGGSRGMAGAIALAGMATLRTGAGLVSLAVPESCLDTVAGFEPCYTTYPLPADSAGRLDRPARRRLAELTEQATTLACGPGLGRSEPLAHLVGWLYRSIDKPLVVDADGLNALAASSEGLAQPAGPRVLTPHPGEFRRLLAAAGRTADDFAPAARELARQHEIVIVLKGHRTLITDGYRSVHNRTGNPGMATGGTGDVLTGMITALLCQGLNPFEAAVLGVHVHGLAGDLAAEQLTQFAMTARDLIERIPAALARIVTPSADRR